MKYPPCFDGTMDAASFVMRMEEQVVPEHRVA